jgi:hypothetical protein
MTRIGHLVAADFRHHRWLLVLWLLVLVASTISYGTRPMFASDPALRSTAGLLDSLLWWAWLLLLAVIVPIVVQTHPLVGSDAFWMTRPIPPLTLLASKTAVLGIALVVVPAVVEAALMASYAVPWRRVALVEVQSTMLRTLAIVVLTAAAVLTRNLARFVTLLSSTIAAMAVLMAVMLAYSMAHIDQSFPTARPVQPQDPTSSIVLMALLALAATSLVIIQYRTRSRSLAVGAGVTGSAIALVVASFWPWPLLPERWEAPERDGGSTLRLVPRPETAELEEWTAGFESHAVWRALHSIVLVSRIEPGWTADVGSLEGTLQFEGHSAITHRAGSYPVPAAIEGDGDASRGVIARLLGVERLIQEHRPDSQPTLLFGLTAAEFDRLATARATYDGVMQVVLSKHELESSLPLRPGVTHVQGPFRFVIDGVSRTPGGITILARESEATSFLDREPARTSSYYLRNRRAGEAVAVMSEQLGLNMVLLPFVGLHGGGGALTGFTVQSLLIAFAPITSTDGPTWRGDDEWFRGAELVIVRTTREGVVERALVIRDFPVRAGSGAARR